MQLNNSDLSACKKACYFLIRFWDLPLIIHTHTHIYNQQARTKNNLFFYKVLLFKKNRWITFFLNITMQIKQSKFVLNNN